MSKFVVLLKTGEGEWKEHSRVEATSRMQAIERTADAPGTYAATTEGQLTELKVEERPALKIVGGPGK